MGKFSNIIGAGLDKVVDFPKSGHIFFYLWLQYSKNALNDKESIEMFKMCFCDVSKIVHGKLKNFNCFRCAHKSDFPKSGHIYSACTM